jgi:transcriptional regulator with XRE-family HTH domain
MTYSFAYSEQPVKCGIRHLRRASFPAPCYEARMKLRVKEIRLSKGMTVETLAARVRLSKSYVSEIENGKKQCNGNRLQAFASALGVNVHDLIDDGAAQAPEMAQHLDTMNRLPPALRSAVFAHAQHLLLGLTDE